MKKYRGKSHVDILVDHWSNGYFAEVNSLSSYAHFLSNYDFLKQWCSDPDNHPEHDSANCALVYALVPFRPNKKDGLDSIWNQ